MRAELGAAMQGGHGLAGIEQARRVEGGLHGVEQRQFVGVELQRTSG